MNRKHFIFTLVVLMNMAVGSMTLVSCGDDEEGGVEPQNEKPDTDKLRGKWMVRCSTMSSMDINYGDVIEFESNGTAKVGDKTGTYIYNSSTGEFTLTIGNTTITGTISFDGDYVTVYTYVDLGLPSGTLWATMNVGASKPEEYGDYFAWGETQPKSDYSKETYFDYPYEKYCFLYQRFELLPEDDAANVNWGSKWRMPSEEQLYELRYSCTWTWTSLNGVNGFVVQSEKNGNSIFLPTAGKRYDTRLINDSEKTYGYYWSRDLDKGYSGDAWFLLFARTERGGVYGLTDTSARSLGFSVRPVSTHRGFVWY